MAYLDSTGLQKQIQYIKAYVANQISAKAELSAIPQFDIQVVNALPTANISDTTVYLVLSNSGAAGNLYTEYIHVNDTWEKLGEQTTEVDLSDYMPLSGGTLTGNIYTTPYYDATIESPEGGQTLIVSKGVSTKGTPPAEDEWHTLAMAVDSTGSTNNLHKYGQMETAVYANGKTESYLQVYKNEADSTTGAKIAIGYDANGNVYTAVPTPVAANNSTQIATTAWVNTALRYYGTCSTEAATAAKTVACTSFILATGARIIVKFTVTNTAANPTLNVNSTGAKAIQYRGAAISAGYLAANRTYEFVYDGTNYQLVGDIDTNTTTSSGAANSTSKLFLVGTTAQATGTTYSNANVYATNGALHATSISTGGNVVVGGTANTNYLQLPSGIKLY